MSERMRYPARRRRGGLLIVVAMALLVIGAAVTATSTSGAAAARTLARRQQTEAAFWAAEAGLQHARWELSRDPAFLGGLSGSVGAATYEATVSGTAPGGPWTVEATATIGDVARSLRADYRAMRYSDFLFVAGDDLGVWDGFEADAPIHVHGDLSVTGDNVVFHGQVSVTGAVRPGTAGADFAGGLQEGATPIPLPGEEEVPAALAAIARAEDSYYEDLGRIVFNADGTMTVWGDDGDAASSRTVPLPPSGIVVVQDVDDLKVSGTVNGRVTIVSDEDIVISGPLDHAHESGDALGLICLDDDIIVDYEGDPTNERQPLRAAMLVVDGSFDVVGWANGLGRLGISGSLAVSTVEGSMSSARKLTDWFHYDAGLLENPPPGFNRIAGMAPLMVPGSWREVRP